MQRWDGLDAVPRDLGPTVVSVGVFDGVHRGHAAVLARAVGVAGQRSQPAVVVTFDPHPVEVLRPGVQVPRLTTLVRRLELIESLGVGGCLVLPFSAELAALTAEEFAAQVLSGALHASAVVVGADFRFGSRAAGDVQTLRELGFDVEPVEPVGDGERWSSTSVRVALAKGDVAEAARILGRPHRLEGLVVRGEQRGRGLGYPTANVEVGGGLALPGDGVYGAWLSVQGERLPTAMSVGTNPTFDGTLRTVEAHVLDRDDLDLYGQAVTLDLVGRLRGMERFGGVPELKAAMAADVEKARILLA